MVRLGILKKLDVGVKISLCFKNSHRALNPSNNHYEYSKRVAGDPYRGLVPLIGPQELIEWLD